MVNISDSLVRLINHRDYIEDSGVKLLYVFSGVLPTKEELNSIKDLDDNREMTTGNLLSFATGRGDQVLQGNVYGSDLLPRYPNQRLVQWPLSERIEEFRHMNDGSIGWFFFGVTTTTSISTDPGVTDPANMLTLDQTLLTTYVGSAGDEESEADFAILSGEVDSNKEYSTTDLEIFFI